jgi:hypothetical protein
MNNKRKMKKKKEVWVKKEPKRNSVVGKQTSLVTSTKLLSAQPWSTGLC